MLIFNGHYNVTDLIEDNRVTKDEILNLAVEGRVPIAVWADNVFIWPVHYSQQNKRYKKMAIHARLCKGEWLYVRRKDLRKQEFERISAEDNARDRYYNKSALLRLLRSGPEADVDTTVSRLEETTQRLGRGLKISLDDLWVPADAWNMIEEETRNESENASAFAIARRVYADILAAHDKNRSLPHPDSCSHGLVYSHLVKQAARVKDTDYWINDPKRNPNEVGNKKGLGTLAICYQPEAGRKPTRPLEIGFREFINAFNEIKR